MARGQAEMTRRKGLVSDANILCVRFWAAGSRIIGSLRGHRDLTPTSHLAAESIRFRDWQSWRKLATSLSRWTKVCTKTTKQ